MATLYRKYRPQNFQEVVGQNHIKTILSHEVESGKIAHAYLFCGPRAVGKTTFARIMAKAINCTNRPMDKFEPCGECPSCQDITVGRAMDVIEIDAASNTGVDNVRDNIIASARVAPSQLKYKVFIIDEVHMLSTSAFNALLKIMEEPPAFVVFILCTTETHKVPATIISRCQRFDFKRISVSDVVKKLSYIAAKEDLKIDRSILEAIARHSGGHMRDAESLLGQIINISGKEITREEADLVIPRSDLAEVLTLIEILSKKDAASGIRLINRLLDEGVDLKIFLTDLVEVLRKVLLTKLNPGLAQGLAQELGESLELRLAETSKNLQVESVLAMLEQFTKTIIEIKSSFILQLPVELAIVRLCSASTVSRPAAPQAAPAMRPPSDTGAAIQSAASAPPPHATILKSGKPVSLDEVTAKWNELLVVCKKYNHSLSFILRVCQPRSINGNMLCLAFKYKFHKDRMADPVLKASMEKVLQEVFATQLIVEAIIDETLEIDENGSGGIASATPQPVVESVPMPTENTPAVIPQGGGDDMINKLLETFGGKVVG